MVDAKNALTEQGLDITKMSPEELKQKLTDTQMKRLLSAYGSTMKAAAPTLYLPCAQAKDDKTRRQWIHRFMFDQSQGDNSASTTVTVNHGAKNKVKEQCVTDVQMAGPMYAGSVAQALTAMVQASALNTADA